MHRWISRLPAWNMILIVATAALALSVSTIGDACAASPTITFASVQLRTAADGDVGVSVGATVLDSDGIDGLSVTVERPAEFGPFPLEKGLYLSPNDSPTRDGYNITIGPAFVSDVDRAGDYVVTVDDGGGPVSSTVSLPGGLVPLAAGGPTMVDTSTGFFTPTVSIPAIPGATHYRILITNDSDSTTRTYDGVAGPGLSPSPSIELRAGIVEAGKFYRFRIDAFDGGTVSGSNRRSDGEYVCYDPATGFTNIPCISQKNVFLVTEADGADVMLAINRVLDLDDLDHLKNPPLTDPPTVPVTVTRGAFGPFQLNASILRNVDTDSDVTDQFSSSWQPLDETRIPEAQRGGAYTFRAEDSTGNVVTVTREFPPGLIPFPPAGPLTIDQSSGSLTPTVSMPPVPGASHYRVVVFNDTDSTRINFDDLPGRTLAQSPSVRLFEGVLESSKSYRIHMDAFNTSTFSTSTVRSRSDSQVYDPSGLDSDGDGIQDTIDGQFAGGFVDESAVESNSFTNQHLGGDEFGTIIDRADLEVVVVAPPDPTTGVRVGAAGGSGEALINACLPTVEHRLTDRDAEKVECGSLSVEVLSGIIEYVLGDITLVAPPGAIMTIQEDSAGQYSVENSPESRVPLTLYVQGDVVTLQPGEPLVSIIEAEIKPGDGPNCINPKSKGVVPVVIFGGDVDVTTIEQASLEIDDDANSGTAGVQPVKSQIKNVHGDGIPDLILHFNTQDLNAASLLSEGLALYITGELSDATSLLGSDVIHLSNGPVCD